MIKVLLNMIDTSFKCYINNALLKGIVLQNSRLQKKAKH